MLQLLVYAGMQIPVGLLVDRFGPRTVILTGAIVLTLAQAGFALAESYGAALLARFFVGMGDAMTWICLLRLVASWFRGRRVPLVTALSGTLGQLGAIGAAAPMTWALGHLGWTKAYLVAAAVSIAATIAVAVVVEDSPEHRTLRGPRLTFSTIRASLGASWQHPGTRLGFWMHFATQFSAVAMTLLWGFPFLVRGEGLSDSRGQPAAQPDRRGGDVQRPDHRLVRRPAPVAPVHDRAHHRLGHRGRVDRGPALARPGAVLAAGRAHQVIGIGGPASMIGFDLARTSNPAERLAQRQRDHQPGRLLGQPGAGRGHRSGPRLAHARRRLRLQRRGVPLGDVHAVPPLGARAVPGLALPTPDPSRGQPRRPDSQRASRGVSARMTSSRHSWTAST